MATKGDRLVGWGDGLEIWDGNAIKSGCGDHCTTINVIKFIEVKKKQKTKKPYLPRPPQRKYQ